MAKLIGPARAKEGVLRLRPIFEEVMLEGLVELPHAKDSLHRLKENGYKTSSSYQQIWAACQKSL